MITEIIENQQNFLKKELVNHFNEEAKKLNLKLKMDFYGGRLILQRKVNWYTTDSLEIRFSKSKNAFCFIEPIEEKVFEQIKPILEVIPENFIVEVIKEEKNG